MLNIIKVGTSRSKRTPLLPAILGLWLFCGAGSATAGLINLQFMGPFHGDGHSGPGLVGGAGDFWNPITSRAASGIALLDSAGQATGVSFSITADDTGLYGMHSDPEDSGFAFPLASLMGGYFFSNSSSQSLNAFTFSGLSDGLVYNFYFLSQGDSAATGRQLGMRIGDTTLTSTAASASTSAFINGQNYLVFSNVAPQGGSVTAYWWSAADEANINGIQIAAVPEPRATALLVAVAAAFAVTFWRRRLNRQQP
jgi:hypothetical protein